MSLHALLDVPAPAKLNLFLHVVGRRDDGYHLLQSLMVPLDWSDTLHFERRLDGTLARHDLGDPLPADDLCLRAARALQRASGTALGADVSIEKRLPSGAGLGGGSSDAATTLLALNRLWGLGWPRERLMPIALSLGADVPFFLGPGPAWVEGIGERLTPAPFAPAAFWVVKPPVGIETRAVFTSPLLARNSPSLDTAAILAGLPMSTTETRFEEIRAETRNDLQRAAESLCDEVALAAGLLEAAFGNSRMTGSGSAVFAVLPDESELGVANAGGVSENPARALQPAPRVPDGWTSRRCRSVAVHPLAGW